MNKSLWGMTGALFGGLWIAVFFAAFSTLALVREAKKEDLLLTSGLFMGVEPGRGRARSINYAVIESDGRSLRFSIHTCEQQIARMARGTTVSVLHDDSKLFELTADGQTQCTYASTVQALAQARSNNLRWTLSGATGGALLVLLAIWSRWRTSRRLTQLRAVMQRRETGGADR